MSKSKSKLSQDDIEIAIEKAAKTYGTLTPIAFLTEIMHGRDPRAINEIYMMVLPAIEDGDYSLDPNFVRELFELIEKKYKFATLPELDLSYKAASEIAKLQSTKELGTGEQEEVTLNEEDAFKFHTWFRAAYGDLHATS